MVPTSGTGVVDINTIPTALIENVEVVTGSASAVYGSNEWCSRYELQAQR